MITKNLLENYYSLILHKTAQKYAVARKEGSEVKYPHQKEYLTEAELQKAIEGKLTLGAFLIQDKTGLVKAGAIDIDVPRDAQTLPEALTLAKSIQSEAQKENINFEIEYSGARGFHLWLFAETPITAKLMQSCLEVVTSKAGFKASEIFPNAIPETKCVKLPGMIHLKSNNRSGFIDNNYNPNEPQILPNQEKVISNLKKTAIEDIARVANLLQETEPKNSNNDSEVNITETAKTLNSFGSDNPNCINHLLNNGAPVEVNYNSSNLTLVRYCLTRGFNLEQSLPLAELMARNTSDNHPTSKDYQARVENFKSVYTSMSRGNKYQFKCSYVLANSKSLKERGCKGSYCRACDFKEDLAKKQNNSSNGNNQTSPPEKQIKPYNSLIFQVMGNLLAEGKEASKSQILSECEKQSSDLPFLPPPSEGETLKEKEAIAFLLQNKEVLYDYSDLPEQGFISGSDKPISEYLGELLNLPLPSQETIVLHLEEIRERGIKILSTHKLEIIKAELNNQEKKVEITLDELIQDSEKLLRRSTGDSQLKNVASYIPDFTRELFGYESVAIKSHSPHLNNILNGGFQPGKFYVVGAPPGAGKSTFCAQVADYASSMGIKVIYASYEMSREQIIIGSLARLEGLNSAVIESKKFLNENYKAKDILAERVLRAIKKYHETIAENLTIIEAGPEYTSYKLKAICKKMDTDLIIIDYLQLLNSGDQKLDDAYQETLRVSKIATDLKRLARDTNTAVIAISDITKQAYEDSVKTGELDMGCLRDSFKIAHSADVILVLQSGIVNVGKGETKIKKDQLDLLAKKCPEKQRQIDKLKSTHPLNEKTEDTYAVIGVQKNRGGRKGAPVFKYSKALHNFQPLDFEIKIDPNEQDI